MAELVFRIDAAEPARRELEISLEIPAAAFPGPGAGDRELFLPTWTPGSYLIREYARQLGPVEVVPGGGAQPIRCEKVAKNRFRLPETSGAMTVRYRVYAHELSVRTAHVDDLQAYWNHACLLLWPVGAQALAARILITLPADWSHACALPETAATSVADTTAPARPGSRTICLHAENLDRAIDAPFLAGRLHRLDWDILGVPHSVACSGLGSVAVPASLQQDFNAIVQTAADVFGGSLPYGRYLFQCLFTDSGHGGLEHADSTTLLMSRTALHDRKGYLEFLSLAAHELFHAWNVKRMRPRELWQYDYENENYTRLLWLMEGWTAYFDDLLTLRAGIASREEYLRALADNLDRMRGNQGRFVLSLEESSFDAWIRLYRPDENTRNSSQNYYGNGAVAAACLDLRIRKLTGGARGLDHVVRQLFERTFGAGRGYTREDVDAVLHEVAGPAATETLHQLVDGELDPDLHAVFADVGIKVVDDGAGSPFLGLTFEAGGTTVAAIQRGSAADAAGLAPQDELLALQSLRVNGGTWRGVLAAVARVGEPLSVLYSRRGMIGTCYAIPTASPGSLRLVPAPEANAEQVALRDSWLATRLPIQPTGPAGQADQEAAGSEPRV